MSNRMINRKIINHTYDEYLHLVTDHSPSRESHIVIHQLTLPRNYSINYAFTMTFWHKWGQLVDIIYDVIYILRKLSHNNRFCLELFHYVLKSIQSYYASYKLGDLSIQINQSSKFCSLYRK